MPLPMIVPATMAMQCHTFSSRTSSRLFGIALQQTCEIAYNESRHRPQGDVQVEGILSPPPYVDVEGQPADHAQNGARLPRTLGEAAQKKHAQQAAVSHRGN